MIATSRPEIPAFAGLTCKGYFMSVA